LKTYAQTLDLRDAPDVIARYVEHHRAVWPEVERGLRKIGLQRMRIWRLDRRLFKLMETDDAFEPERDFARYLEGEPRIREWQELMASMQEPAPGAQPGELWANMEPAYTL
jgi:L-rhamnose mutarotase